MTKRPEHVVSDAVVGLGRALREAGVTTTVDGELALCRALGQLDLRRREHVYWAGRSTLVHHHEHGAVYDAVFRRAGMLRVVRLEELFDAVQTLATARVPRGERMAIVTNGGGAGVMATDALIDLGGHLAELSAETVARLDQILRQQ